MDVFQKLSAIFVVFFLLESECCQFPDHWIGTWYQSGIRKIISIEKNRFTSKGACVKSDGDKFLIANDEKTCFRCVVIHEKHYNVLQYKETFCHGRDTINKICASITGDAMLYSMFRENAAPIPCPLKPPYTFAYNRGHGECKFPVSTIDSCTQDNRLLIKYQACPDVHGSESSTEEIQCFATWKEGSYKYLVGILRPNHLTVTEDLYRCFVIEKTGAFTDFESVPDPEVEYRIAQSGDATCSGLFSPVEGSRTMTLKKSTPLQKCKFPSWMVKKKQWHTLDYRHSYFFTHHDSTLVITNTSGMAEGAEGRSSFPSSEPVIINCAQDVKDGEDGSTRFVSHYITGCQRGYLCLMFHRRSEHISEMQMGTTSESVEEACSKDFFDMDKSPFITLLTPEPETKVCPFFGNFRVNGVISSRTSPDKLVLGDNIGTQRYTSAVDIVGLFSQHPPPPQPDFRIKRNDRDVGNNAKNSCVLNFDKLLFGCKSPDTMEFRSDCPLDSSDIISLYLCHGSWSRNSSRNSSVHYLVTTPVSRTSRTVPRYCFMYQTREDSSAIHFTSTSDTCYRGSASGPEGALVFNITPIGTGICAELNATSAWSSSFYTIILISLLISLCAVVGKNFYDIAHR